MSFHLFPIIFLFFQITTIKSVYVFIEPKEKFCLKKYRNITQVLHIIYSISGKEEDRNIITVYDPDEFNMLRELDSISNKVYLFVEKEGYHKFCIENLASHQITLNFHFGDEHTEGKVSVKNAESFVDSVTKLAQKIDDLKFNIGNSVIKKKTHFKIAQKIREKINICTGIKIVFLLVFAVIQIIMITSIFNKVKIVKRVEVKGEEQDPLKNNPKNDIL